MATVLSVRAESALLCLLQSHPFQLQEYTGTGTAAPLAAPAVLAGDHPQPPQQPAQGFPLAAQKQTLITAFHTPITWSSLQDSGFHLHPGWMKAVSFN